MMPYVVISSSEVKCSSHLEPFPFPHYPAKGCGDHRMDREIDSTATSDCGERNSQVRARPYSRTGFLRGHNPFMLAHWLFWQSLGDRRRSAMEGLMVATGASGHGFKWTWFQVSASAGQACGRPYWGEDWWREQIMEMAIPQYSRNTLE